MLGSRKSAFLGIIWTPLSWNIELDWELISCIVFVRHKPEIVYKLVPMLT